MQTSVRWSAKRRALLALLIPLWGGLSWHNFTSSRGSPEAGWMTFAAMLAALLLQVHTAYYRVDTSRDGITERWLWKRVQVSWNDVLQVDAIGQAALVQLRRRGLPPDRAHTPGSDLRAPLDDGRRRLRRGAPGRAE